MNKTTIYESGSELMDAMYHQDRINRSGKMRRFLPPTQGRGSHLAKANIEVLQALKKELTS